MLSWILTTPSSSVGSRSWFWHTQAGSLSYSNVIEELREADDETNGINNCGRIKVKLFFLLLHISELKSAFPRPIHSLRHSLDSAQGIVQKWGQQSKLTIISRARRSPSRYWNSPFNDWIFFLNGWCRKWDHKTGQFDFESRRWHCEKLKSTRFMIIVSGLHKICSHDRMVHYILSGTIGIQNTTAM